MEDQQLEDALREALHQATASASTAPFHLSKRRRAPHSASSHHRCCHSRSDGGCCTYRCHDGDASPSESPIVSPDRSCCRLARAQTQIHE